MILAAFASVTFNVALEFMIWGLMVKDFAIEAKFFETTGYCAVINCAINFQRINVFGCFCDDMTQFELMKLLN